MLILIFSGDSTIFLTSQQPNNTIYYLETEFNAFFPILLLLIRSHFFILNTAYETMIKP